MPSGEEISASTGQLRQLECLGAAGDLGSTGNGCERPPSLQAVGIFMTLTARDSICVTLSGIDCPYFVALAT